MGLLKKLKNSKIFGKVMPYVAIPLAIAVTSPAKSQDKESIKGKTNLGLSVSSNNFLGLNWSESIFKNSLKDSKSFRAFADFQLSFPLSSQAGSYTTKEVENQYIQKNFNGNDLYVPKGAIKEISEFPIVKLGLSGVITNSKGKNLGVGGGVQVALSETDINYNGKNIPNEYKEVFTGSSEIIHKPYIRIQSNLSKNINLFTDVSIGLKEKSNTTFDLGLTYSFDKD